LKTKIVDNIIKPLHYKIAMINLVFVDVHFCFNLGKKKPWTAEEDEYLIKLV